MNLLLKKTTKKVGENRAFTQYVAAFIGIMIVAIIAVSVTIPTVTDAITNANLSGTTKTVIDQVPLMIGIAVLMLVVGLIR